MNERSSTPPPADADEFVEAGDQRIADAFRRSLWVFAGAAVVGALIWWILRPVHAPVRVNEAAVEAPRAQAPAPVAIPPARFTDVTKASGIGFVHHNGAYGEKLLPETMGGGVAVIDVSNNGRADLLFVDSGNWPWKSTAPHSTVALYVNDGRGHFHDATQGSGLESANLYGMGVAIGDFDNDGYDDILITGVGGLRLYRNLGGSGRFEDVTAKSGITSGIEDWNTCAAFVDVDNDGLLDLVVCRYVRWSRAIDRANDFQMTGIGRAYGPPTTFEGTSPRLFHNNGNGTFTDLSEKAGLRVVNAATGKPIAKTLGVLPIDIDGDGHIDLVFANDTVRNFLFRNRGDGTFTEVGVESGVAYDSNGNSRGAMGIDAARYRNDSEVAIAIGNFANEMSALYVGDAANGALRFDDQAIVSGIGPATRLSLTFGVLFFDYDLDGRPDLFHANGHIEDEINKVQSSQRYAQPMQLFWNCGASCPHVFAEVQKQDSGALATPIVGRGAVYADLDGDGDLDLVVTQIGGPPLVLRNDQSSGHHWLRVRLEGSGKVNRDAIGSWVEVTANGLTQRQQVMPARGYLSQVERTLTFGLGETAKIERLRVHWTDGTTQDIPAPAADHVIEIKKAA
jgi:enediyne biosynthesis protein E4